MIVSALDWIETDILFYSLRTGELEVEGRLRGSSNGTLRCTVNLGSNRQVRCVYKPVAGERPLWDFPNNTLSKREVASYAMSEALALHLVPPTVWRHDGPLGPGMCQVWIDEIEDAPLVAVVPIDHPVEGWHRVFDGTDGVGNMVSLVHSADDVLQQIALFDAVINNADRKGGHLIVDENHRVWAIDHGVAFSAEDKLRTVLWGWAGSTFPTSLDAAFATLVGMKDAGLPKEVTCWLGADEIEALSERISVLIEGRSFPEPSTDWPAIPWPVF